MIQKKGTNKVFFNLEPSLPYSNLKYKKNPVMMYSVALYECRLN